MEETELRERLDVLAVRTCPPLQDPADLVGAVAARHRVLRRRTWSVGAMIAAVLVLVPAVRFLTTPESQPASPSGAAEVYTSPTRGSLAADTAFLDAVRRLPWTDDTRGQALPDPRIPDPPVDSRNVVWASDTEGYRWALVAGVDPIPGMGSDARPAPAELADAPSVAAAWFGGPSAAGLDGLEVLSISYGLDPELPTAIANGPAVLVVGAPGDTIEVSYRPRIDADGTVSRTWEPGAAWQGVVAIFDDAFTDGGPAFRYRVLRDGILVSGAPVVVGDPTVSPKDVSVQWLRPQPPADLGDAAAVDEVTAVLSRLGLAYSQVTVTALWAGEIPMSAGRQGRLTVLALEVPSGARYVTGVLGYPGAIARGALACGSEIRPATDGLDEMLVAVVCDAAAGLVVVAPPGATTVQTIDGGGRVTGSHPLLAGVAVLPVPADLDVVRTLDAAGEVVGKSPRLGTADLG